MQVFKVFFKVVNKHKITLFIYIMIYLVISLVISKSLQENGEMEFSKVSLKIGVENNDQGELGEALVSYLKQYNQIMEIPKERAALQDAMYYQEIDYVLVIPKEFTEKFTVGEGEQLLEGTIVPGSRMASLIDNEVKQYLNTVSMYLKAGVETHRALEFSAEDMQQKAQVGFLEKSDNQKLSGEFYFFQYISYVFLVLMILGFGTVIRTFQDKDLAARNKCSATPFFQQNIQVILGSIVLTFAVYMIFMGMLCLVSWKYLFTLQGVLSAINALVFAICAVSVAWFCVQFVKSNQELNIMSNVFSLSFSFLGGVFVPLGMMSDSVKKVSKFIPSYWYEVANEEIQKVTALSKAGKVWQSCLIVALFSLSFFSAGLLVKRMKQRSV